MEEVTIRVCAGEVREEWAWVVRSKSVGQRLVRSVGKRYVDVSTRTSSSSRGSDRGSSEAQLRGRCAHAYIQSTYFVVAILAHDFVTRLVLHSLLP